MISMLYNGYVHKKNRFLTIFGEQSFGNFFLLDYQTEGKFLGYCHLPGKPGIVWESTGNPVSQKCFAKSI